MTVIQVELIPETYDPESIMSSDETGKMLGVSPHTLRRWRNSKKNLDYHYLAANRVGYKRKDVLAFLDSVRVVVVGKPTATKK